jgi:3-phosphoshikimate 1-carboxyvinyltransferase
LRPIGDKSLTHRGLLLAALARGRSRLRHPNPGEDCAATARALGEVGAPCARTAGGWEIEGAARGLRDPESVLDLGNSGTGIRLLTGLLAGQRRTAILTGDDSLRRRPMGRIASPLRAMGATVGLREGDLPPIILSGEGDLRAIHHRLPVASAQVKSCLLLAGLGLREGTLVVEEPGPSRDHTERLLAWLGIDLERDGHTVRLPAPAAPVAGFEWSVPGDPSAASFYLVAAAIVAGSEIRVDGVGLNPTRTGALDALVAMGAELAIAPATSGDPGPEPVGTITSRAGPLAGIELGGELVLRALDEIPILAVAAAFATGETWIRDAGELRVKESDRIASIAAMIRGLGGEVETTADTLRIVGSGRLRGGRVETHGDHRIAMSAIVAGCAAEGEVEIDDVAAIATSDPTFLDRMVQLGARFE